VRAAGPVLSFKDISGKTLSVPVQHSPYVMADRTIVIFPGEKLTFALPSDGSVLGTPRRLGTGENAAGAVTVTFDYQNNGPSMQLVTENGLSKTAKYDGYTSTPSGKGWLLAYSPTCPLRPLGRAARRGASRSARSS